MKTGIRKIQTQLAQSSGLSLVEVILVIVLIGIVAYPISRLSVTNTKSLGQYAKITKAVNDLECISEQIWADYKANGYAATRTKWANRSGAAPSGEFNYSVQVSSEQTLNNVTYVVVTVNVTGNGLSTPARVSFWLTDVGL